MSGAWQRKEGKNKEGGLNAKGRASYNAGFGSVEAARKFANAHKKS